jgi:hypothetical protein
VNAGTLVPDARVGRALSAALQSMPHVSPDRFKVLHVTMIATLNLRSLVDFQAIYDGAMNDHLMVAYLVSLSRAQLALSRRLQAPQQQERF